MKGIIGAICGDIIGSVHEFNPIKTKDFDLIDKSVKFTDDTVMTLAVANWLLVDPNLSKKSLINQMQNFGHEYPRSGYGGRFNKWLVSDNPEAYNSWGNGSAMRVSPVAWYANTLEDVMNLAEISAVVTHNHPEGIKGAVSTAACIYLARTGSSKEEIKEFVIDNFDYDLNRKLDDIRPDYEFEVSCQKSVPESILCFLEADDYEDTIRNAVSLGGDADTQAAISGSIASAYYEVPDDIFRPCITKLDTNLFSILREFNGLVIKD
jgi:ADP-ribosylglycohydrolase